jgi:hypothetical protein
MIIVYKIRAKNLTHVGTKLESHISDLKHNFNKYENLIGLNKIISKTLIEECFAPHLTFLVKRERPQFYNGNCKQYKSQQFNTFWKIIRASRNCSQTQFVSRKYETQL